MKLTMKCKVCNKEIGHGQRYKTETLTSIYFCSKECYENYLAKPKAKSKINYKPKPGSQRRRFTDYLQDWTDDKINWAMAMKQAKDIQQEYKLDWNEMYLVCKYARVYEGVEWNYNYGLGQIFPRYIQPCMEFREAIKRAKLAEIPNNDVLKIKKKSNTNNRKVEWE